MTLPELRNGIAQLLGQADTPGAMDLLHHFATEQGRKDVVNAVVSLRARFGRLRSDNARGVLATAELDLGMNKINNSILELLDQLETPPKIVATFWGRIGLFTGILALVAGFLLFRYLPEKQSPIVSVPPVSRPIDSSVSKAVTPAQLDANSSREVSKKKDVVTPNTTKSNGEAGKSAETHAQNPQTTPYKPSTSTSAPTGFMITLRMDSPWQRAKVFVDGKEWPLEEDLDYTKKIRLRAGAHVITLRMADGKTCEQSRSVSGNTTVYFTCSN